MTQDQQLKRERVRIQITTGDESIDRAALDQTDRKLLKKFDKALGRRNKTGDRQHGNNLRKMRLIAEHRAPPVILDNPSNPTYHGVALSDTLSDPEASRKILDWINDRTYQGEPVGEKTRTHLRGAVRMFGRLLTDAGPRGDEIPLSMAMIPGGDPRSKSEKNPTPRPGEIMWWDPDIINILDDSSVHIRTKAIIAVAWDSGGRPEEVGYLTMGQLIKTNNFYKISLGGKNHPERDVTLAVATPYLRRWLKSEHPANNHKKGFNPDTAIWSHKNNPEPLGYGSIATDIKNVREELNLSKELTLSRLRKSRASILAARPDINQGDLETRLGWEPGSSTPAHYIARFGKTTDANVGEGDGIPKGVLDRETDDRRLPGSVRCPNCDCWTARHLDDCMFCFAEFSSEHAEDGTEKQVLRKEARYRDIKNEFISAVLNDRIDLEALHPAIRFGRLLDGNEEVLEILEDHNPESGKAKDSIGVFRKILQALD